VSFKVFEGDQKSVVIMNGMLSNEEYTLITDEVKKEGLCILTPQDIYIVENRSTFSHVS